MLSTKINIYLKTACISMDRLFQGYNIFSDLMRSYFYDRADSEILPLSACHVNIVPIKFISFGDLLISSYFRSCWILCCLFLCQIEQIACTTKDSVLHSYCKQKMNWNRQIILDRMIESNQKLVVLIYSIRHWKCKS